MSKRGRPRARAALPQWFDLAKYHDAANLTPGEWYLNLYVRAWIRRGCKPTLPMGNPQPAVRQLRAMPLVRERRRCLDTQLELDCIDAAIADQEYRAIREGKPLPAPVHEASPAELHTVRTMLPAELQAPPSATPEPPGWYAPLGESIPAPLLAPLLRMNLALPDKVLLAEVSLFLRRERARLAALAPHAPFLRALTRRKRPAFDRWASFGLLPLLDLRQWEIDTAATIPRAVLAESIGYDEVEHAGELAKALLHDFTLRALLLPEVRGTAR